MSRLVPWFLLYKEEPRKEIKPLQISFQVAFFIDQGINSPRPLPELDRVDPLDVARLGGRFAFDQQVIQVIQVAGEDFKK